MECVAVSTGETEYTTNLLAWTLATYGASGGNGTPAYCSGFNKMPRTFGVGPGGSIRVVVDVSVRTPRRQVAQATVTTSGRVEASGQAVTPQGAVELQRAAEELLISLRVQGGRTTTNAAQTTVKCLVVNAAEPIRVPESGCL